jgi:hypothetical protein
MLGINTEQEDEKEAANHKLRTILSAVWYLFPSKFGAACPALNSCLLPHNAFSNGVMPQLADAGTRARPSSLAYC